MQGLAPTLRSWNVVIVKTRVWKRRITGNPFLRHNKGRKAKRDVSVRGPQTIFVSPQLGWWGQCLAQGRLASTQNASLQLHELPYSVPCKHFSQSLVLPPPSWKYLDIYNSPLNQAPVWPERVPQYLHRLLLFSPQSYNLRRRQERTNHLQFQNVKWKDNQTWLSRTRVANKFSKGTVEEDGTTAEGHVMLFFSV